MIDQSYPCFYPGEFSPPTKYHLNAVHWLLSKPEVHRINIVLGADAPGQISQDQKARLWEMLLKSKFSPQAGIIKAKANGPMSEIYEAFNKDKKLPAFVALDEKASRNKKLQERFESFPYFGIQIIPSQFHEASRQLMSAAENRDFNKAKKCLPDDFSDDAIHQYMDILYPKKQDPEAPEEKSPYVDYKSRYMNMFNDGFWKSVFQPMSNTDILTEGKIKDDIKKKAFEKFKKENPALTDGQIDRYIKSFEYNMEKPKVEEKNILQYTWKKLEDLIDGEFGTDIISKPKSEDLVDFKGSEDVVYNDNKLLILLGDIREKCIRYGQKYSWCISRKDSNNMFYSYRMRMNEPVFYFIFDEDIIEKDPSNKYHAIVIYVNNQGEYMVADAENKGDREMSWEEIVKIQPKLKKLRSLIKHIPLSAEEKADYEKYKKPVNDEEYKNYNYDEKYKYIQFGHELSEDQIRDTPEKLIPRLVATGVVENMPEDVYDRLSGSDKKILYKNRRQSIDKEEYYDENDETKHILTYLLYYNTIISDNLKVRGRLDLTDKKITSLPDNLEVGGDLILAYSNISSLPDNLEVGGNLSLFASKKITSLPDNLKVIGSIDLGYSNISSLPDNLEVGDTLHLGHTIINTIPISIKVKNLDLVDSKITSLPDNLEVGGDLNLNHSAITSLPDNLKVGGSLYLYKSDISFLPNDLKVGKNLSIPYSKITTLPDNIKVGGIIRISKNQLDTIQDKYKNKINID